MLERKVLSIIHRRKTETIMYEFGGSNRKIDRVRYVIKISGDVVCEVEFQILRIHSIKEWWFWVY